MKTTIKITLFTLVCLTVALSTLAALAAATNAVLVPVGIPAVPVDMTALWNTLVVVLVPCVVAAVRKFLPNIPKVAWPLGAALLGVLSNWLLAKSGALPHSSWQLGALCGAAAIGVREIADQSFGAAKVGYNRFVGGRSAPPAKAKK